MHINTKKILHNNFDSISSNFYAFISRYISQANLFNIDKLIIIKQTLPQAVISHSNGLHKILHVHVHVHLTENQG